MTESPVNPEEVKSLILKLLKSSEELKGVVGPLIRGQINAQATLNSHTDTLTQLINALVTVRKSQEDMSLTLTKLDELSSDRDKSYQDLEMRLEKVESIVVIQIMKKIKAKKEISEYEIQELEIFAKHRPQNSGAWYVLAVAYETKDKFEQALSCFDKMIHVNDKDGEAWCRRAICLQNLEKHDESIESFSKAKSYSKCTIIPRYEAFSMLALGRNDEALSLVNLAIEVDDKDPGAWWLKGRILMQLQRDSEALGCIEKSLELKPDSAIVLADKAEILQSLGPEYYEQAKSCLDKALQINPSDYQLWRNMGQLLTLLKNYEESIKYFDKAIELRPKDACLYCLKAIALNRLRKNPEALSNFDKALEIGLEEKCEQFYYCRAIVLATLNRGDEALSDLETAISIKSDYQEALVMKLSILSARGRLDEAMKLVDTKLVDAIIQHPPEDPSDLNSIAWALYKVGMRMDLALKFAIEATQKGPHGHTFDTLACILYKLGKKEEALASFEKAMHLKRADDEITWSVLAKLYDEMGRSEDAKKIREQHPSEES